MIARVSIDGDRLTIERSGRMSRWFGPPVDVPLAHVESVELADPELVRKWNLGIRLAGFQIPGYLVSGLFRKGGELTWWHLGRGKSAIVIELRDERFARVVVEVEDPTATKAAIEQARAPMR